MKKKFLLAFLLCAMLLNPTIPISADSKESEEKNSNETKQYLVVAKDAKGYDKVKEQYSKLVDVKNSKHEVLKKNKIIVADMTGSEAESLKNDSNVLFVEEDYDVKGSNEKLTEADKYKLKEFMSKDKEEYGWNIKAIDATKKDISDFTANNDEVNIAVIDSGVAFSSDLDDVERISFINNDTNINEEDSILYDDVTGHGTSIMGVIGAKENGKGIIGIDPNANLYSLKVFDNENSAPISRIIASIYWAIDNNIDIINMSFGTLENSEALKAAIQGAYNKGILMVAASGNKGNDIGTIDYPAEYDEVLAVGSTNASGEITSETSLGEGIDILAPGDLVTTTGLLQGYATVNGTSIAAAHVTGVASLLWTKDNSKSNEFIKQLLIASANRGINSADYDIGLVNAKDAFETYVKFSEQYIEGEKPKFDLGINKPAETYEIDGAVNGSWGPPDHYTLVINHTDIAPTAYVTLAAKAARATDRFLPPYDDNSNPLYPFHGRNNYVANLHMVYRVAWQIINDNPNLSTDTNIDSFFRDNIDDVTYTPNSTTSSTDLLKVRDGLKEVLKDTGGTNGFLPQDFPLGIKNLGTDITANTKRAWIILGVAAHLATDTYAHRSIVPKTSIIEERFDSSKFVVGGVSKWNEFKSKVELEIVEFRDIKTYAKDTEDIGAMYEDSLDCYTERYDSASDDAVEYLIYSINNMHTFDPYFIMVPDDALGSNPYYRIMLNNFKDYTYHAGYNDNTIPSVISPPTDTSKGLYPYRFDNHYDQDEADHTPHNLVN